MGRCPLRLTTEKTMVGTPVDTLYEVYAAAFGPLRTRAAARHVLTAEEFAGEMADDRIDKYVVWAAEGHPVGLTTLTTDLSAVPWISDDYYASRYPEHAAGGSLYYLGYTLVHPDHESEGITGRILARVVRRLRDEGAVCGFDVSRHNDAAHHIGDSVSRLSRSMPVEVQPADVQTYYVADFTACAGQATQRAAKKATVA